MDFCVSHFRTEDEVQLYPLLLSPSPLRLPPHQRLGVPRQSCSLNAWTRARARMRVCCGVSLCTGDVLHAEDP